ncbi:hypothetical protein Tco_1123942 [Tanacetum coccineum]|uniref:Uncharacterized protein n=1 Tax=Tanacetum coccineum TaxID=301880 RepID=A0ABQ5J4P1_9ASTR
MGYLVHSYCNISPTGYYKDDPCWSADLKSKTTEDIISIGSFVEVLVLNQYVLVRKLFSNTIIDESGNATSMGDKSISKGNAAAGNRRTTRNNEEPLWYRRSTRTTKILLNLMIDMATCQ